MKNSEMFVNTSTRTGKMERDYYEFYQPYCYHTSIPLQGVNIYSFATKPEKQEPCGSMNLSRLSSLSLAIDFDINSFHYAMTDNHKEMFDFQITIKKPREFALLMDNEHIARQKSSENSEGSATSSKIDLYEKTYNDLLSSDIPYAMSYQLYRSLPLKTHLTLHVFSVSNNILRVVNGYAQMAYVDRF